MIELLAQLDSLPREEIPDAIGQLAAAQARLTARLVREATPALAEASSDRLLDAAEVAARLRVKRPAVYELIRTGRLPSVRFGQRVRVRESALRAFIDHGCP